jgi:hypothetical protein
MLHTSWANARRTASSFTSGISASSGGINAGRRLSLRMNEIAQFSATRYTQPDGFEWRLTRAHEANECVRTAAAESATTSFERATAGSTLITHGVTKSVPSQVLLDFRAQAGVEKYNTAHGT